MRFIKILIVAVVLFPFSQNAFAVADCIRTGAVTISDVQSAINMFLGLNAVTACVDTNDNKQVSITEVQNVINAFLGLDSSGTGKSTAKLVQLSSNSELEAKLKAELVKRYDHLYEGYLYGWFNYLGGPVALAGTRDMAVPAAAEAATSGTGATPAYSETNVQEKGVDEGDFVKTDGNFLYLARGSRFIIIKTQPPEQAAIVSDIDLKEQISELYLNGNQVTIITAPIYYYYGAPAIAGLVMPGHPVTRLYLYDTSTPAAPVMKSRFDFPGTLQGSRRIGDTMYLVTNYGIDLPSPVTPWNYLKNGIYDQEAFKAASAAARDENLKRIATLTLAEMLPSYSRTAYTSGTAGTPVISPVVNGSDVYAPLTGNGADLSLVIALNSALATSTVSSSGVLSSWCRMYMSTDSLYLASGNDWLWIEPLPLAAQQPVNPEPQTSLHKFSISGTAGKPLYKGSGVVYGWLNDRFSMGEYNGNLRIGTTRGGWWGEGISNRLALLAEQNGSLTETGSIENIAPSERIYSMRLDGARGYMVTFRQTDPLYTFDLSDPLKPRIAGEIKVNGFATYIHPMGQNNTRLLTIGRSADDNGRVTGNKLQLFNVSNLDNPALIGSQELGAGWSDALYDPHAFLYYEPLSLLAIPYFSYDSTSTNSWSYRSGLSLFTVDTDGIIAISGSIQTKALESTYSSYSDTVDRSVVIGSDIYAIAHRSVSIADAATLKVKKTIDLPEGYQSYYPVGGVVSVGSSGTSGK